jgi:hypothetical protein
MSEENIIMLIDIIYEFVDNGINSVNNRLTTSGMFWTVADQISKNFKQGFNRSTSEDSDFTPSTTLNPGNILTNHVDHELLWRAIFNKLHQLASSSQIEVRKHSLKNLENIFMKHGSSIPQALWLEFLKNKILDLLKTNIKLGKLQNQIDANHENNEWQS